MPTTGRATGPPLLHDERMPAFVCSYPADRQTVASAALKGVQRTGAAHMDGRDDQATDARLTVAASQGDDEAFGLLYERYAPRIGAYLSRLLDDEHLAQDLTHEVFVSALRRLRTDRPPIAFGPWLYRIARNASIDVHRRSQIVRQVPLDGAGEERPTVSRENAPEDVAEGRPWLGQLRDILGGVPAGDPTVLVLPELPGLAP